MDRRKFVSASLVSIGAGLCATRSVAAAPVRFLVGFAPGGTVDVIARAVVEALREHGINGIVDNRVGSSGKLSVDALLAAPADGQTFLIAPSSQATLLPFTLAGGSRALTDTLPVGAVAQCFFALGVNATTGPKTLADFLRTAKSDNSQAFYAVPGSGSTMDFLGQILARKAAVPLASIPYKGGAAALNDVVGGTAPSILTATPNLVQMQKSGRIRLLGVTSEQPLASMPEVPTFASQGFSELNASEFISVFARRGTPPQVVAAVSTALKAVVEASSARAVMERQDYVPRYVGPKDLELRLQKDAARWQAVVKAVGFKAE